MPVIARSRAHDLPEKNGGQRARHMMLCDPKFDVGNSTRFLPRSFGSDSLRRVCRNTLQAATLALQPELEERWKLRAALADMKGKLRTAGWEDSAIGGVRQLWLTDCESLLAHLVARSVGKTNDKRLRSRLIQLMAGSLDVAW